jgi:hypothetical protein
MAALTPTSRAAGVVVTATRNTASASDTFTYVPNTNQVIELHNNTAGSLTAVIKGSAPSAAFPIPGAGATTVDLSAGLSVVVAASQTKFVALDAIAAYLAGTGVVTVTGAATLTVVVLNN